jgi:hypothetical protein
MAVAFLDFEQPIAELEAKMPMTWRSLAAWEGWTTAP